jgi:hypothetical protein
MSVRATMTPLPPGTKVCRLICGTCSEAWIAARRTADEAGTPMTAPTCPDQHAVGWVQPYDVEYSQGTFPVKWASSGLWTLESTVDVMVITGDCAEIPELQSNEREPAHLSEVGRASTESATDGTTQPR